MKENYKTILTKFITANKLDYYVDGEFIGTYIYDPERKVFQGKIGYIPLSNIPSLLKEQGVELK